MLRASFSERFTLFEKGCSSVFRHRRAGFSCRTPLLFLHLVLMPTLMPTRVTPDDNTTVAVVQGQIAGFVMVVDNEVEQVYVSALLVAKAWPTCSWRMQNDGSEMPGTPVPGSLWWRGMREPGGSMNSAAGPMGVSSSTLRQVTMVQSLCLLIDM